jgi:nonsense-mediated mRNA decay protein 3
MFCVECGKEKTIFQDGLCIDCYIKKKSPFFVVSERIELQNCVHCNAFKHKKSWYNLKLEEILKKILENEIKTNIEINNPKISIECEEKRDIATCNILLSGFLDDHEIKEKQKMVVYKKKTVCPICSKKAGGYFEAILQLRSDKKDIDKKEKNEVITTISKLIQEQIYKDEKEVFLSKVKDTQGGVDFYISKKEVARNIAKKLHERFGGTVKASPKLVGMKEGKRVYRMTYLVRLPKYKKGDFIRIDKNIFLVTNIKKRDVHLLDLSNWEKKNYSDTTNLKIEVVGTQKDIEEVIVVSESKDELQIMFPKHYEIKEVVKPKPIQFKSKTIKIFRYDNEIFILPPKT